MITGYSMNAFLLLDIQINLSSSLPFWAYFPFITVFFLSSHKSDTRILQYFNGSSAKSGDIINATPFWRRRGPHYSSAQCAAQYCRCLELMMFLHVYSGPDDCSFCAPQWCWNSGYVKSSVEICCFWRQWCRASQ